MPASSCCHRSRARGTLDSPVNEGCLSVNFPDADVRCGRRGGFPRRRPFRAGRSGLVIECQSYFGKVQRRRDWRTGRKDGVGGSKVTSNLSLSSKLAQHMLSRSVWNDSRYSCDNRATSRCPRSCLGTIGKAVKFRHVPNAVMGAVRTYVTGLRWEDVRIGVNLSQKTGLEDIGYRRGRAVARAYP